MTCIEDQGCGERWTRVANLRRLLALSLHRQMIQVSQIYQMFDFSAEKVNLAFELLNTSFILAVRRTASYRLSLIVCMNSVSSSLSCNTYGFWELVSADEDNALFVALWRSQTNSLVYILQSAQPANLRGRRMNSSVPVVVLRLEHKCNGYTDPNRQIQPGYKVCGSARHVLSIPPHEVSTIYLPLKLFT